MIGLLFSVLAALPQEQPPSFKVEPGLRIIQGTASYRERMMIVPGSTLRVSVLTASSPNAGDESGLSPASPERITLGESVMKLGNTGSPISFAVPVAASQLADGQEVRVEVTLTLGDSDVVLSGSMAFRFQANSARPIRLSLRRGGLEETDKPLQLMDTPWQLVEMDGKKVILGESTPTLLLSSKEGRVTGFGGINSITGEWTSQGQALKLSSLGMTKKGGPFVLMAAEQLYIRLLALSDRWELKNGVLTLFEGKTPSLRFRPAPDETTPRVPSP